MALKSPPLVKPNVPAKADTTGAFTVKVATSNLFILDEKTDQTDLMADAIIEDIGGQEIINLTRNDLLNGENVAYNIIANLAETAQNFNPNNLIKMQGVDAEYFNKFSYPITTYISDVGTGRDASGQRTGQTAYVDPATGDVVVNVSNLMPNQRVEVEFILYEDLISNSW